MFTALITISRDYVTFESFGCSPVFSLYGLAVPNTNKHATRTNTEPREISENFFHLLSSTLSILDSVSDHMMEETVKECWPMCLCVRLNS